MKLLSIGPVAGLIRRFRLKSKASKRKRITPPPAIGSQDPAQPHLIQYRMPLRSLAAAGVRPRILIIKVDHIGDYFVALPALEILRDAWPEANLTLICAPGVVVLAQASGLFDAVVGFQFFPTYSEDVHEAGKVPFAAIAAAAPDTFDLAIDLRHDPDTRPLLDHVNARYRVGFTAGNLTRPLDLAIPDLERGNDPGFPSFHAGTRLSVLAQAIVHTFKPRPPRSLGNLVAASSLPLPFPGAPFVVLSLGAGSALRKWPEEKLVQLADHLVRDRHMNLVLIGGERERGLGDAIAAALRPASFVDSVGAIPLIDLPRLIAHAALFIGHDTGITHLAAQLGVPTLCIYGGVSAFRVWGPVGERVFALQAIVPCAPCHIPRFADCRADQACMRDITIADVIAVLDEISRASMIGAP